MVDIWAAADCGRSMIDADLPVSNEPKGSRWAMAGLGYCFTVTGRLETVTFDRPRRVAFRLVRGPVPQVTDEFSLSEHDGVAALAYAGELGADFGVAGLWWGARS